MQQQERHARGAGYDGQAQAAHDAQVALGAHCHTAHPGQDRKAGQEEDDQHCNDKASLHAPASVSRGGPTATSMVEGRSVRTDPSRRRRRLGPGRGQGAD